MMTGKAVARAVGGHLLVYRAISSILTKIFNVPSPKVNPNVDEKLKMSRMRTSLTVEKIVHWVSLNKLVLSLDLSRHEQEG